MSNRNLFAALVGINFYQKARNLDGCINDVLNFDRLLRNICSQQQGQLIYEPLYLLSPHDIDKEKIETYKKIEKLDFSYIDPSFENISGKAFNHLEKASGNDICLFYYSGHGSFISAPPEFWHTKPTHQNETLVCMDSRSTARDLVDKELAYLLHKTLKGKPDVHCLLIMDCCSSGNNTRALNEKTDSIKYRQEPPSNFQLAITNYLGFKENFFTIENGKASFTMANYIHLAACRDHEKAQDGHLGGVFSRKLVELLSKGGTGSSYRNIEQSLASTVSIQNGSQNPVAFSNPKADLDKQFLGGKMIPYKPAYEVRYMHGDAIWQLQAGSMQGIVASAGDEKTLVNILPDNIEAEVISVDDFTSTLKGDGLAMLDTDNNNYTAIVTRLAIKRQVIGISERLRLSGASVEVLHERFRSNNFVYIELYVKGNKEPDFLADLVKEENKYLYSLSQARNDIPLFKSEGEAGSFLTNADAVGKWVYVKNLESRESIFDANDFVFTATVIEGIAITRKNINSVTGQTNTYQPGSQIELTYKNDKKPALRFSVEINSDSKIKECYIQALYLDNLYGIHTDFSETDTNRLVKGGKFELKSQVDNQSYNIVRLKLDDDYAGYNINEIVEQVKIVISAKPNVQLNAYGQEPLKRALRGKAKSIDDLFDSAPESLWAVFNFKVRIIGPQKDKELIAGGETDFSSFTIQAPAGFNAIATAVTNADIPASTRSIDNVLPAIWGNILAENTPFNDDFVSMGGSSVIALELGAGEQMPVLKPGEELIIKPKRNAAVTRSVNSYESTTVPYGYDEETQLYFPIGYEDKSGNIRINQLPKSSTGALVGEAITTRSVLGSIKLYFKKLLRLPTNTFTLHLYKDKQWEQITDKAEIKKQLKFLQPGQKLPLIVHGIFGDTKGMLEGLKEDNDFAAGLPAILSYDFENLNTKVPETATALKKDLEEVGIGQEGIPKTTIIAHSMGGLVSRWLIEQMEGDPLVEKLIMAGTPNGGSEWGQASEYILNGANFLLTHALNVTGPIKYAITGISFFIKKFHDPQASLNDMDAGSPLISKLENSTPPPAIPYLLIGSDTSLFREYEDNDVFLSKLKNLLMGKIVFPGLDMALFNKTPNDMAVTVASMKKITGFDNVNNMQVLAGDHISYFSEETTRKAILALTYA